jgi:hypothetical protein
MNGLMGTRVIVVDNRPDEAIPLIEAFASKGIPVAFFTDDSPPPPERLSGVRLAVLDMRLIEGGADLRSEASALVGRLKSILSPRNGPYVILAWTIHPENLGDVERYLAADADVPKPLLSVALDKRDCRRDGRFDVDVIRHRVEERLGVASPLLVLMDWEGRCFGAATDVVNTLSALASGTGDLEQWRAQWAERMRDLMRGMATEEAGEAIAARFDTSSCLRALYAVLDPLHADRMEHNFPRPDGALAASVQAIIDSTGQCGGEATARLNAMLHVAWDVRRGLQPGNIYLSPLPGVPGTITAASLIAELVHAEQRTAVSDSAPGAWLELGPVCDHAQGNIRFARLIAGLLVPAARAGAIKRAGFIWDFGPLFFERGVPPGPYHLCLSARHLTTLPVDDANRLDPVARLRTQALASLQAWFAGHAARPAVTRLPTS